MEAIKFTLSGDTAFFKKPEVNAYCYFTYNNIHQVALLGMFGAILGYNGYAQEMHCYPEFYEKLRKLKVCIVPKCEKGIIKKKIQTFNNSVGYASKENGGNLIVKEQWLENPVWDIYILLDCDEARILAEKLETQTCVYMPYLGKNDHPARISNINRVFLLSGVENVNFLMSLFPKTAVQYNAASSMDYEIKAPFLYEEYLPISVNESSHLYEYELMCMTDMAIHVKEEKKEHVYVFNQRLDEGYYFISVI